MLEISRPDPRLVAALRHLAIEYGAETVSATAHAMAVLAEAEHDLESVHPSSSAA